MGGDRPPSESPTLARSQLTIFYLGEGIIAGVVFYILVYGVTIGIRFLRLAPDAQLYIVGAIVLFFLAILPKIAAWSIMPKYAMTRSPVMQVWHETRQWRWVGILGLLVGSVLVVGSVIAWGGKWPSGEIQLVGGGTLILGVFVRALAMYLSEKSTEQT